MNRACLVVVVLLAFLPATLPARADERIVLTINNRSSLTVERLNTYPVDGDGEAVEDNLGALLDDLPAGATTTLTLSLGRCGLVRAYVGMQGGSEIEGDIDTCTDTVLNITD